MLTYVEMFYVILETLAKFEISTVRISTYKGKVNQIYFVMNDLGTIAYSAGRDEVNFSDSTVTVDTRIMKVLFFLEGIFKLPALNGYEMNIACNPRRSMYVELYRPANAAKQYTYANVTMRPSNNPDTGDKQVGINVENHVNNQLQICDNMVNQEIIHVMTTLLDRFHTEYGYDDLDL